ncbi:hypothetical protein ADILRU_1961 [Leifsonia rubra CMS 76R]|nr:hypothetical protein ADILRU_1961 [Leifsonia rubra CMS 76R]
MRTPESGVGEGEYYRNCGQISRHRISIGSVTVWWEVCCTGPPLI